MKIFVDMDGVLADFVSGICEVHGKDNPYFQPDGVDSFNKNIGRYSLEKIWGLSTGELFAPCDQDFWTSLEPTLEGFHLVDFLIDHFGRKNICILSRPHDEVSLAGKVKWLRTYFPKLAYLFGPAKEVCAGPRKILIDDNTENVFRFSRAGGTGILFPRPWNNVDLSKNLAYTDPDLALEQVKRNIIGSARI